MNLKSIVRRLKTFVKGAHGKELTEKPDVICVTQRFGADHGGWDVVTSNIDMQSIVYSLGVG
ncbi:MAG: hypothetical protein KBH82_12435, partial [Syntrophorhabdaceae bacterium]|nr:hypothetical protein [Syntrophorhabdaceae bacterium]